jgi:hypothetical protein
MAWRGITMISCGAGKDITVLRISPVSGNPKLPRWVDTTSVDKDDEGNISKTWKKIQDDPHHINRYIESMQNKLCFKPINNFLVNRKLVGIGELFPQAKKAWVMFEINENRYSLLVVGTKTAREQLICGQTKRKESNVPLILSVVDKSFQIMNSI